mgnify:CR=1 FL=1
MIRLNSLADLEALAGRLKVPLRWLNVGLFLLMTLALWACLAACILPLVLEDGVSQPETSGLCITGALDMNADA